MNVRFHWKKTQTISRPCQFHSFSQLTLFVSHSWELMWCDVHHPLSGFAWSSSEKFNPVFATSRTISCKLLATGTVKSQHKTFLLKINQTILRQKKNHLSFLLFHHRNEMERERWNKKCLTSHHQSNYFISSVIEIWRWKCDLVSLAPQSVCEVPPFCFISSTAAELRLKLHKIIRPFFAANNHPFLQQPSDFAQRDFINKARHFFYLSLPLEYNFCIIKVLTKNFGFHCFIWLQIDKNLFWSQVLENYCIHLQQENRNLTFTLVFCTEKTHNKINHLWKNGKISFFTFVFSNGLFLVCSSHFGVINSSHHILPSFWVVIQTSFWGNLKTCFHYIHCENLFKVIKK